MAEQSDGCKNVDDDMFWEEVSRIRKLSDRDSSGDESGNSVIKRTKVDNVRKMPKRSSEEIWKVMIVFEQKGGPDLHPIHITKAIEKEIGKINHARFMGNGRLLIFAKSEEQRSNILMKESLNKLKITSHIPGATSKARGVIAGIPTSVTMEEIKENLSKYGITDAKRLTKGKEKTESTSILLSFNKDLPTRVQMGYMSYMVREYIPPPLRCFKCQRFGHVAGQCRGKIRCAKCGGEHEYGQCGETVLKCCNCGGPHSAAYGGCEKQKEAKEIQKYRVTYKASYADATKIVKKDKRITSVPITPEQSTWSQFDNSLRLNNRVQLEESLQQASRPRPTPASVTCRCECKTKITKETLLVDKNEFIAFICTVMNTALQHSRKSDRIKSIVDIANDFLGSMSKADVIHEMINLKYGQTQGN